MIRSFLTICLLSLYGLADGQSLDEIKSAAGKNQWDKAKEGIVKYLAQPANASNADAWHLKSLIFYKIVTGDQFQRLAPQGHHEAFEAYTKYLDLSAKAKNNTPAEHDILFGVVFNNIERANHYFQQKKYTEALDIFLDVEEMEDFIVKKGLKYQDFSFPAFDTQLYVNIAASAVSAKRDDIAVNYYQKIADNRIVSKGFDGIYRYLVDRADKKGDKPTRDKYLMIGRELYPADPYWCQAALRDAGADKKKIFLKYEELIRGWCNNYLTHYNYAVELYNYSFKQASRPADYAKYHQRIPEILKKALAFQSTADANLLMCRYQLLLTNDLIDNYNAIHDNTPDRQKKKDALTTQINQRYEEVQTYAMNVYNLLDTKQDLQPAEKENFITACKMLSDYWERKGDKVKEKEYWERIRGMA